jgi:hypothetical protein
MQSVGRLDERREEEHQMTSVLSTLSCRRFERIQFETLVVQRETTSAKVEVQLARQEPYIDI